MALNPQSQSCENEMPQTNTKERLPYLESQVRIKVQPTSADKISLTTNELETLRPTEVLIAEMSSAFERFVSHFRELETNLSHDHPGSSRENLTDEEIKDDHGDPQLPHRKQLLAALSRNGLTWEDYKNTMIYLESEKANIHPNKTDNTTDLIHVVDEADEEVNELLSDLKLADGTINERLSVPNVTTSGKFNPIVSPQMKDINKYWDSSSLNSLRRDKIHAREPTPQTMNVKSTTNRTNEELKERLERKLEESRIKKWSYYKDLMDSTAQWQSSSREPSSTTITSKWLDPLPDPEENIVLPKSLGDSLEKQLEEECELIKQRMAELERIRAEEEARLKRIEQLATEARETRQRCREPLFEPFSSSESDIRRPKTADNVIVSSLADSNRWFSVCRTTPNHISEPIVVCDNDWLKVKDFNSRYASISPVRPCSATTLCNTECEKGLPELQKVPTPECRIGLIRYAIPKRSSSEGRRTAHINLRRLSGSKRNSSSRDSRSDTSPTTTARLPILFTKRLDTALEQISPYASPEATNSPNLACCTTCLDDSECKIKAVQAIGDPSGSKKFYGPVNTQAEKEENPSELQMLPDLGRASLAIHEDRFTGEKPRSGRTSRACSVPPTGRTAVPFSKFAISGPQNAHQLQEKGTCPTDHLHSCHLTRTISPAASLCHNQTIPLQISLGGRSISTLTTQSIPSLAIVSPESNDAILDATESGTVGSGEPKNHKCYQINITLDLDQALQRYNLQKQSMLSPTRVQTPGGHLLGTVERRCDTECKSVSEFQSTTILSKLPNNESSTPTGGHQGRARINDVQITSQKRVPVIETPDQPVDSKLPPDQQMKPGKKSLLKSSVKKSDKLEISQNMEMLRPRNVQCSTPEPGIASHQLDKGCATSYQMTCDVMEDETVLPEGSMLLEAHSLPQPFFRESQPSGTLENRGSSFSDTIYYSMNTNGPVSDKCSCAPVTEVPSNISFSDSNTLPPITSKSPCSQQDCKNSHLLTANWPSCWKVNSKDSKSDVETAMQKFSSRPRRPRRAVSVTYMEPRGCAESTETLHSIAPQVANLVESGLLIRPRRQELSDAETSSKCRRNTWSGIPNTTASVTVGADGGGSANNIVVAASHTLPLPNKANHVSFAKSPIPFPFSSPLSVAREDEFSLSSFRGDDNSGQLKFTQEQLCLQSISDPIDLVDSPTSICSNSSSFPIGCTGNKATVDPSWVPNRKENNRGVEDETRNIRSRIRSPVTCAPKPDCDCGDLDDVSNSVTVWTQAQSWSVGPNTNFDLTTQAKRDKSACVEEVHSPEQCRLVQAKTLIQTESNSGTDVSEAHTKNHCPKQYNFRQQPQRSELHMGWNNNAASVDPCQLSDETNGSINVDEKKEMMFKWIETVRQTASLIPKCKGNNPARPVQFAKLHSLWDTTNNNKSELNMLLDKYDTQCNNGKKPCENYALLVCETAIGRTISDCLPRLKHLRVLHLTRCQLSSDVFHDIEALPHLEWLNLSHNRLTYLECEFPKLEILDVSHNLFEHLNHLGGSYTSLLKLNISSNMLSSIDCTEQADQMPQLQVLDIRDNLFTTTSTIWLNNSKLGFVGQVSLSGNQIRQLEMPFIACHLITHLDLSNNLLDNLPVDGLFAPLLQYFVLDRNNLTSLGPLEHSWLPNLQLLKADENRIIQMPSIRCPKLQTLSLRKNQIHDTSKTVTALKWLSMLCTLDLRYNPLCLDEQLPLLIRQKLTHLISLNATLLDTTRIPDNVSHPKSPLFDEVIDLYFPSRCMHTTLFSSLSCREYFCLVISFSNLTLTDHSA